MSGEIRVGQRASLSRLVTLEDIEKFAEVTLDRNPVHLDEKYAAATRFGGRVAHGLLGVGLISALLGNHLPGPGTVYLGQEVRFEAPIYPGATLTAEVEVVEVRQDKPVITLATTCRDQEGRVLISGRAVVLFHPPE